MLRGVMKVKGQRGNSGSICITYACITKLGPWIVIGGASR